MGWEIDLIKSIQGSIGTNDIVSWVMLIFTNIGDGGLIWVVLSFVLLIPRKTRVIGVASLIAFNVGVISNEFIIKEVIQRTRPIYTNEGSSILAFASNWLLPAKTLPIGIFCVPATTTFSFMSGHTTMAFAVAATTVIFNRKIGIPALVVAALVGFSRIYFGVHFPTDVIGGMLLGLAIGFSIGLFVKIVYQKRINAAKAAKNNRTFYL